MKNRKEQIVVENIENEVGNQKLPTERVKKQRNGTHNRETSCSSGESVCAIKLASCARENRRETRAMRREKLNDINLPSRRTSARKYRVDAEVPNEKSEIINKQRASGRLISQTSASTLTAESAPLNFRHPRRCHDESATAIRRNPRTPPSKKETANACASQVKSENCKERKTAAARRSAIKGKTGSFAAELSQVDSSQLCYVPPQRQQWDHGTLRALLLRKVIDIMHPSYQNITTLVNRVKEADIIRNTIAEAVTEQSPRVLFISGAPGTGKSLTVSILLKEFQREGFFSSSAVNYLNGALFSSTKEFLSNLAGCLLFSTRKTGVLSEVLSSALDALQQTKSVSAAIDALFTAVRLHRGRRAPGMSLLVIDELDLLESKLNSEERQKGNPLLLSLIDQCLKNEERIILLGVSNALSLGVRLKQAFAQQLQSSDIVDSANGAVAERLSRFRTLSFAAYSAAQMTKIVEYRLAAATAAIIEEFEFTQHEVEILNSFEFFERSAVLLVAKRVASTRGDCRQMLETIRGLLQPQLKCSVYHSPRQYAAFLEIARSQRERRNNECDDEAATTRRRIPKPHSNDDVNFEARTPASRDLRSELSSETALSPTGTAGKDVSTGARRYKSSCVLSSQEISSKKLEKDTEASKYHRKRRSSEDNPTAGIDLSRAGTASEKMDAMESPPKKAATITAAYQCISDRSQSCQYGKEPKPMGGEESSFDGIMSLPTTAASSPVPDTNSPETEFAPGLLQTTKISMASVQAYFAASLADAANGSACLTRVLELPLHQQILTCAICRAAADKESERRATLAKSTGGFANSPNDDTCPPTAERNTTRSGRKRIDVPQFRETRTVRLTTSEVAEAYDECCEAYHLPKCYTASTLALEGLPGLQDSGIIQLGHSSKSRGATEASSTTVQLLFTTSETAEVLKQMQSVFQALLR